MFLLRFLLVFLILGITSGIPQLCLKAKPWSINGRAFIDEYRGKVLFLAFMRLECPVCFDIIQKADTFMRTDAHTERFQSDLSIVVVAPHSELDSRVSYMQSKYPAVRIVKETNKEPLWGWLRVGHHDGLVFDRCGRLAKHVRVPRLSNEISHELFNTLRSVLIGKACGFCAYDEASQRRLSVQIRPLPTAQVLAPQITAYVVPQKKPGGSGRAPSNPQANNGYPAVKADYGRNNGGQDKVYAQQQQPGVFHGEEEEVFTEQKTVKLSTTKNGSNGKISTTAEPFYPEEETALQAPSEYYDYIGEWATPPPSQHLFFVSLKRNLVRPFWERPFETRSLEQTVTVDFFKSGLNWMPLPKTALKLLGDQLSDGSVQIPKPSSPSAAWPTKVPLMKDKMGLPCAGYSDDICYQQQMQLPANEVHNCCKQRILFTDQCVPGRCSNSTQQLCCIQKFLQAKSSCCQDERQGEPTSATDKFSQCCYEKFVESDDSCCSYIYSRDQWKAVHELCLPNVFVDLSNVKVKTVVPGTSVTTDFHFGQTNRWKFNCKYGAHVPQYSYFEDDVEPFP